MDAKRFIVAHVALTLASSIVACGLTGCLPERRSAPPKSSGRTLYVSNLPDCGGQHPCYTRLQRAVDAASDHDVIKVAGGTYTGITSEDGTSLPVVAIDKAVYLLGGYHATDWSLAPSRDEPSVVDAEHVPGRRAFYIDGSEVPTITVRGFDIRGGNDPGSGGGGIRVDDGSVVLEGNLIEGCTTDAKGGGLFIADGTVRLTNNTLRGNVARFGGALYVDGGSVVLRRNVFMANEAPPVGGAIAINAGAVEGANNVVADNVGAGAGVYLTGGRLTASHWTLANNGRYAVLADLGIDIERGSVSLRKSILASHEGGLCGSGASAHQTLFYDVARPCLAGASCVNNLFGDPKFVDPWAGDYHIAQDSAAIDQGYSVDVVSDMDGDPRPVGPAADIGADEITPHRTYLPSILLRFSSPRL